MNATAGTGEPDAFRPDATPRVAPRKGELEREGDEIRADMDRTLGALERKFSPDQLLDRSLDFLRENGSNVVQEIGETVRNHPLPMVLTAAGLIWLTSSIARSRASTSDESTGEAGIRAQEDRSSPDGSRIRRSVHAVQTRAHHATASFVGLVHDQPLAVGALAVATGALIGAALPISRYETELMGPAADRAMAQARQSGKEQLQKVRESLDAAVEAGVQKATEVGEGSASSSETANPT
ncbi:MAG TPA: hypothetical protein VGN07_15905 [Steroidobacteraceae bacterium]